MFPFFTIFMVIFIVVFTIGSRQNSAKQQEVEENFWKRENEANHTRKQDISKLDYISIPLGTFPMNLGTEAEDTLRRLAEEPILNLTGISNTDLKMTYGVANLETLSQYDTNFATLVKTLNTYSAELVEAGKIDSAIAVMEYAVSIKADAREIFFRLADIYKERGDIASIQKLLEAAESLPALARDSIKARLTPLL